ncbi:DUF2897 family protein [Alkalimonas sp.]|uniref:DUF2897 family protein n=1 Tax=Alkalimonas sp. TaxID=1872453 RepID=UPI00263B65EA|nr:DUF2897 family protein [Alkalimonas sp.]MCC5824769.1 DUF2897 family protein [Alkalimonas sp.]
MNWMLVTALALAFGIILGNLMLLRYLDKLPGNKAPAKPDKKPDSSSEATGQQHDNPANSSGTKESSQRSDDDPS